MQVAWPLRHPGVDRPFFVSPSLSFLSFKFFILLSLPRCIYLLLVFSFTFSVHIITLYVITTLCLPSTTLFHRASVVPSHCRCGSISCVGFVVTCGQSFQQSWLRMCLDRFCQKLYRSWCKDMPGSVPHTGDTCKSGIFSCPNIDIYAMEPLLAFPFRVLITVDHVLHIVTMGLKLWQLILTLK